MLKFIESVVFFVPDVAVAAAWYADIFGSEIGWENPKYAFVKAPGVNVGFHPADEKCPGGVGGSVVYWEVESMDDAIQDLTQRGAKVHRGPGVTDFGAKAAMLIDPFGCAIGLNQASPKSLVLTAAVNPAAASIPDTA
jgi:predicted enzyme related to lactoylglutathione lyase